MFTIDAWSVVWARVSHWAGYVCCGRVAVTSTSGARVFTWAGAEESEHRMVAKHTHRKRNACKYMVVYVCVHDTTCMCRYMHVCMYI